MSLILDALRKSEAERRRGQVPDLHAELPPISQVAPPRRRVAHAWWIAGVLLLVAAGALVASRWPIDPPVTAPPVATTPPAPAAPARPAASSDPTPAPVAIEPTPAQPKPETMAVVSEPAPRPAPPPPAQPVVAPSALPVQAPAETASIPPPTVATAPPALAAPGDAIAPPLRVADLSAGEREQLPPLKISMHMWGPTPQQRFAIIDGTRVGQGDRVGAAVVTEIVADGVILDWQGRRIALPVR